MILPNFMCIGAAKSGTTSLYDILKQHSDVYMPFFKEPHFFDIPDNYMRGVEWYSKTYYKGVKDEKCIGDFSPTYLFDKEAPKRIYSDLGKNVKFIIILRNPVDRAYSQYLHMKRDRFELLSFKDALSYESERLKEANEKQDYLSKIRFSYIQQGLYAEMLNEYFKYFPKENFLILNFENEFVKQRKESIKKILLFLNVKNENIDIDIVSNIASKARFIWLKNIMNKSSWWILLLKNLIPFVQFRRIIRNRIQRANNVKFAYDVLSDTDKKDLYNRYFRDDLLSLEIILNKKMNWQK